MRQRNEAVRIPPYSEYLVKAPMGKGATYSTTMADLLARWPAARTVLGRHGMACVGCTMARFETIAEAARAYGLRADDLIDEIQGHIDRVPGGR